MNKLKSFIDKTAGYLKRGYIKTIMSVYFLITIL